ncbi:MAG: DUF1579 domain-containing protein, partial [Phycisphaerales bacterium]|nr:DUF1579 domain-containing protein [Phycisphaerales bacterium]
MHTEPSPEHAWLKQLVGEWTFESESVMGPDQPPTKFAGVEKAQMLGDLWLLCEGRCEMPGGGMMESRMTVGFDPRKKRFVGTWIGTPMAYMFVYEGELSADGR